MPVEEGPALETPPEGHDPKIHDAEAVPARPVKQSTRRVPRGARSMNSADE